MRERFGVRGKNREEKNNEIKNDESAGQRNLTRDFGTHSCVLYNTAEGRKRETPRRPFRVRDSTKYASYYGVYGMLSITRIRFTNIVIKFSPN